MMGYRLGVVHAGMVSRERAAVGRAKAGIAEALQGRDIPAQGNALGQRP